MCIGPEVRSPAVDERRADGKCKPCFQVGIPLKRFDGFDGYMADLKEQKKANEGNRVSGNGELLRMCGKN